MEHALSCSHGGFPSIRHNKLCDITTELMSEVCHNVGTEPSLQPITGEHLIHRTANREDGSRLDVAADSFWDNDRQRAFFDIRVFNPFAPSYQNTSLAQCYRKNELEKKRAYDQRVREIEHGSFSPLVFSTTGGIGAVATVVYKRLAAMIAEKHEKPYSKTMQWIRSRLCFSLLRSAIMCLRGSQSSRHHPVHHHNVISGGTIDLACSVGGVLSTLHWFNIFSSISNISNFHIFFHSIIHCHCIHVSKRINPGIKNHKHVTHHACVNRDIRLAKSLSDKEPKKGASLTSHLVRISIIVSFCQGSMLWRSLALSSKLVYIGTANFNDIHNLLMRFVSFFFSFLYISLLSVQET